MSIDTSQSLESAAQAPTDAPQPSTTTSTPTLSSATKKRKLKDASNKPHVLHQSTFRKTQWTYFHLSLITPGLLGAATSSTNHPSTTNVPSIDPLTTSLLLRPALHTYLGLTGSSIPIDVLKTSGRNVWIRIQREDARGLRAALSSWQGSCDAEKIPGVEEVGGRVKVAWRVVSEEASVLGVHEGADGRGMFGE